MNRVIGNIQARLTAIRIELIDEIKAVMRRKDLISIPENDLIIDNKSITKISFFDGWQTSDVCLYHDNDNDWTYLSGISNINDLIRIFEIIERY